MAAVRGLNSNRLQKTHQAWGPSSRTLFVDGHQRDFVYQNNRLTKISTNQIDLTYAYTLNGTLKTKTTPLNKTTIHYNASSLPENLTTHLPDRSYDQSFSWDRSGKLSLFTRSGKQQNYSYTPRGYFRTAGNESYEFDFGLKGVGIRTEAPQWTVPSKGLDSFGKIITEIVGEEMICTTYDLMGQVVFQNKKQFEWDPWGRLLKVTDAGYTWKASYDGLGRHLQTRYTPVNSSTIITTSLYDPEEEFQEIGLKSGNQTFWKIYGPGSCEALIDEKGIFVFLNYDPLGNLTEVISPHETVAIKHLTSPYGPQTVRPFIASNLMKVAKSLSWHSKSQDPTGLIWMGARYYEPRGGRFISPDPVGYPVCLDLYAYANGDPINYIDPDGRFASKVYEATKPTVMGAINHPYVQNSLQFSGKLLEGFAKGREMSENTSVFSVLRYPRLQGSLQVLGGLTEAGAGAATIFYSAGSLSFVGYAAIWHVLDHVYAGCGALAYAAPRETFTSQGLQKAGMSREWAGVTDGGISIALTMGATAVTNSARIANHALSTSLNIEQKMLQVSHEALNTNPLSGTKYTMKVIDQMRLNAETAKPDFHAFPRIVDNYAKFARTDYLIGGDGIKRIKITLPGGYRGRKGCFEWIIGPDKTINHRLFVPNP